jgi:hypothetical protein
MHGAGLNTSAAADAQLLVDHVHAGLGVLADGAMLAGTHALTALDADIGLGGVALGHDADAAQILIELLIKSLRAGLNALQASHTFGIFLNNELLHKKELPFSFISPSIIHNKIKKINGKLHFSPR